MGTVFCLIFGWWWASTCAAEPLPQDAVDERPSVVAVPEHVRTYPIAPDIVPELVWASEQSYDTLAELRGQVVMIDFWTFGCINCQRALPHVVALYEKYRAQGFVVIGVHAPEFAYERKPAHVRDAMVEYGIEYPVVLDNDFQIWRNFHNRYWPAQYIIGRDGTLRYEHIGEGAYAEMDQIVRNLLEEPHESI